MGVCESCHSAGWKHGTACAFQWTHLGTRPSRNFNLIYYAPVIWKPRKEVSLNFRWLEVVLSVLPLDNFEQSENQTTKKWNWVFTPPPQGNTSWWIWGDYSHFPPAMPRVGGRGSKWLVHYVRQVWLRTWRYCIVWLNYSLMLLFICQTALSVIIM